uniref:Uncharacterized protein n=1 Tax=Oryza rufipogon TaxID=4529 RepID=A0A0E0P9Z8_ORYRU
MWLRRDEWHGMKQLASSVAYSETLGTPRYQYHQFFLAAGAAAWSDDSPPLPWCLIRQLHDQFAASAANTPAVAVAPGPTSPRPPRHRGRQRPNRHRSRLPWPSTPRLDLAESQATHATHRRGSRSPAVDAGIGSHSTSSPTLAL